MILTKESLYLKAATFDELLSNDFESVPAQKNETELGAKRLAAWCHAASGGDWNLFSKRLKRDNLKYNYVLTRFSSAKISQKIKYPQWVKDSLWIQSLYQNQGLIQKKVLFSTKQVTLPFENIFFNLVNESLGVLKASISSKALRNFSNAAIDDISYQLLKTLSNFLKPYLFERFSKYMQLANKKTKGTSTTKRNKNYKEYVAFMINNKGIINSFTEKPVMLRMIATITRQWINTNEELISRIEADQSEINKKFKLKLNTSNNVSKIIGDLSDPHNSGHTVQILELHDRNKFVYKPKDCGLDFKFAELIEKLNSEKGSLKLRIPKIISKESYGWSEHIDHNPLDQSEDESLFFKRAGAWLSLFHNFSGTDMHFENIIACKNHPVPIDIEMILQGSFSEHLSGQKERKSIDLANTKSINSVMSVGILPAYLKASDNQMIDIGGLSHRLHQPPTNKCIDINTDAMKFVAKDSKVKICTNLPHKKNKNILLDKHTEIFLKGYQQYSLFLNSLFKNNGFSYFLNSFKSHSTRKVIKPTRFYATLMIRLKNTNLMDDGVIWSADLDFVSRLCDWNKKNDSMWPSIKQERIDLSEFNIPVFYMGVNSKKIINPRGYVCELDSKSGFQQSLERFKLLSEDEIRWQSEIIKISHEILSIDVDYYIELKRNNIKILSEIDEMDLLLAKIMYDIRTKQNFGKSDITLVQLIKTKYGKISKEKNLVNSARFRIRLFKMYSRLLLQERDYQSLEKFLIESYNEFGTDKLFNRSNHNEKLTLLTYLTNCLYKTKKYKQSLKYSEQLLISMKEYDSFLYDKYLFYYYNMLVLNYAKTDKKKALDYLNKASKNEVIKKLPSYISFIYLNRSLIYFHQDNFIHAQKNMSRLILQEDFLLLDKAFQLKILIADIIIRFKNGKHDIIDKIKDIRRNYKQLLLDEEYVRDREMINIISKKIYDEDIVDDKKRILSSMSDYDSEDLDIISYNLWLRNNL